MTVKTLTALSFLLITSLVFGESKIIQHNNKTIHIEFNLPQLTTEKTVIEGQEYTRLDFKGSVPLVEKGAPLISYKIEHIAIPPGSEAQVQFQIIEKSERQQIDLLPLVLISGLDGSSVIPKNENIYNSHSAYPGRRVEISKPYEYRKMRVVDLKIYPIHYYPLEKRIHLLKRISIYLKISGQQTGLGNVQFSSTEKSFLKKHLLNFDQARTWTFPGRQSFSKIQVNYDFSVGDWYKIPVNQEGIYKITGSFLDGQGIDISSINTNMIQMFNYGGMPLDTSTEAPVPQDINEIAIDVVDNNGNGILDGDDIIYFYGRHVDGWKVGPNLNDPHPWIHYHHLYDTKNYYIITFNQANGKRIQKENSIQLNNPVSVNSFMDNLHFEEDRINLLQSGSDWYWEKLSGLSDQTTIDFTLPQNITPSALKLVIRFKGASKLIHDDPLTYKDTLDISLNGQKMVDNHVISNSNKSTVTITDPPFRSGSNELFITLNGNIQGAQVVLDYFEAYFQRPLVAENNYLKINYIVGTNPVEYSVSSLEASGNRIWDVSNYANVRQINPFQNSNTTIFQDQTTESTPKQYIVFASSVIKDVQDLIRIENSPDLRDTDRKGKFLIIVPEEFYEAAEPLEIIRESQQPNPIETERIRLKDIYREFSSGVQDPTAIRNFLKWSYDNWRSTPDAYPEFVLLLGDGGYDYKGINIQNYINRVPAFEIAGNTDLDSRESDHYYTSFGATTLSTLTPTIAIARLPVNSISEINSYIEKISEYRESYKINPEANGWQTTLTFVADDENPGSPGSEWFHLNDTETLINNYIPSKFDVKKIYLVDFETQAGGLSQVKPKATEALLNQINRGTLMINFFGHGNPDTWAHEQVLTKTRDLNLIQNEGRLPLWVAATCTWGKFDDPGITSMGELMVSLTKHGGIGVLSATRPVYASANRTFVHAFYEDLFHNKSDTKPSKLLGYALLTALKGSQNYQKFRLYADPTLKLGDSEHQIVITSISPDTLKALSTIRVDAKITDKNGTPIPEFQGEAILKVFDTKDSLSARNETIHYTVQGGTIFKGRVSVNNGELNGQFIVPKSIKYDKSPTGRISLYAWSENNSDAAGYQNGLRIFGTESIVDSDGPDINITFDDQPDFFDGDYVSRQPTLLVQISDENGINLTREVGHRIELSIDDKIKKDITDFFVYNKDSYQNGKINYTLPALSPGQHKLRISAWDNVNNFSELEINFRTTELNTLALEDVVNYPNPFAENTHFTFQFQSPSGFGEVKVKIYTVSGRLIQELEGFARPGFNKIEWDGLDRDGDRLANGVYIYKIIIDDGEQKIEKIEKLAVLR